MDFIRSKDLSGLPFGELAYAKFENNRSVTSFRFFVLKKGGHLI